MLYLLHVILIDSCVILIWEKEISNKSLIIIYTKYRNSGGADF